MKKILAIFIGTALVCLAGCVQGKTVVDNSNMNLEDFEMVTLKFANQHPVDSFASQADQKICDDIFAATDGRVKVELYVNNTLGDYTSVFEEVMLGSIDMAHTTPVETYDARMSASMLPYLSTGYDDLIKAYDSDNFLFQQISDGSQRLGIHFLGFFCEGFNGFGTNKPLNDSANPGSDKGVVVRSPGAAIYSEGSRGLGFRTSSIAYSDTYTAIQTGVVDGWVGGPANLNYLYFRDVIKYFYNYQYNQESTLIYINKKKFDSLLPQDQDAIERIVRDSCEGSIELAQADDLKYMELLEQEGIEVVNFTDEERAVFANHIRTNVWPKFAKNTSEEFINGVIESMK